MTSETAALRFFFSKPEIAVRQRQTAEFGQRRRQRLREALQDNDIAGPEFQRPKAFADLPASPAGGQQVHIVAVAHPQALRRFSDQQRVRADDYFNGFKFVFRFRTAGKLARAFKFKATLVDDVTHDFRAGANDQHVAGRHGPATRRNILSAAVANNGDDDQVTVDEILDVADGLGGPRRSRRHAQLRDVALNLERLLVSRARGAVTRNEAPTERQKRHREARQWRSHIGEIE